MLQHNNSQWSRTRMEMLMDIVSTLADHTGSPELCAKIPDYLSKALNLEPITLAVIQMQTETGEPGIKFIASGAKIGAGEGAASLKQNILELYEQTRPLTTAEGPMLRDTLLVGREGGEYSELAVKNNVSFPRAMVFSRGIDETHRLLVVLHQHSEHGAPAPTSTDILALVAGHLAKLLKCLVTWQEKPEVLGGVFGRLTGREWTVLRALNSDNGEKQLADQLNLSPHTLHSHIKSIYRKVGVQGRLPLLLQVNEAILKLRVATVNMRSVAPAHVEPRQAVAVG